MAAEVIVFVKLVCMIYSYLFDDYTERPIT